MSFLKEEAFKVRNAAVEIFTLAAEFFFSGRHGHRKAYQNLFHPLFHPFDRSLYVTALFC